MALRSLPPLALYTVKDDVHCVAEEERCGAVSNLDTVTIFSW